MTLVVHTARVSSRDPDRLDVTRASGGPKGHPFAPSARLLAGATSGRFSFAEYEPRYLAEMRASYRENGAAWDALLVRPRVVLCCYCTDPARCHRSLLAGILGKLGAHVRGEVGLEEAIAHVRMVIAEKDKLTARDVITATLEAGAESCVVWTVLEREKIIPPGTYQRALDGGLRKHIREARTGVSR